MISTYQWWVDYLQQTGSKKVGKAWQCPAHPDSYPSMSLAPGANGRVIINCFAGCTYKEILDALGLPATALFEPMINTPKMQLRQAAKRPNYPQITHHSGSSGKKLGLPLETRYHSYANKVRLVREVFELGKRFRWEVKDIYGNWRYSRDGEINRNKLPLYYQQEVDFARAVGEEIVLCESESSVEALTEAGLHATTWAGGANSVPIDTLRRELSGMDVLWVPDHDLAGLRCSELLTVQLAPYCRSWRVMLGDEGEDARDLLNALGREAFIR